MPYTIAIPHDTPQALTYVEETKKLDSVEVTEIREFEGETQEQYELIMALSRKTNRTIARKLNKAKSPSLPFKD